MFFVSTILEVAEELCENKQLYHENISEYRIVREYCEWIDFISFFQAV